MKHTLRLCAMVGLVLVLLLAGCSNANPNEEENSKPKSKPAQEDQGSSKIDKSGGDKGTAEKYSPTIEMTTVNFSYPTTKFLNGEDINNNIWTRTIEEEYGIKVNTEWYVPHSEYESKLNLMIASGKIPDFFVAKPEQFGQLAEAGIIEDMTQIYEDYASENIKNLMKDAGDTVLASAMYDGKLMAIPWTGVAKESPPILWIRTDWKEKLNLPDPKTIDDLFAIADAFVKQDPDGNGLDDTYGLVVENKLEMILGFFEAYGSYLEFWLPDDSGKLAYEDIQPETKEALRKLNEMYEAKHFDPEFIVKDRNKVHESIGANKIGMMIGNRGSATYPLVNLTPEQTWQAYEMPTVDGQPFQAGLPLNIFNYYWVVKKGAEHPEAIFKMMDLWLEKFYYNTSEEEYNKYIVSNTEDAAALWTYSPVKTYLPDANIDTYRKATAVMDGKLSLDEVPPSKKMAYERIMKFLNGESPVWNDYAQNAHGGSASIVDKIIQENRFVTNQFYALPTKTMAERSAQLEKLRDETFVKIITGNLPIDAFDQFVEDWKKQGGDLITEEVNDWYASQQ